MRWPWQRKTKKDSTAVVHARAIEHEVDRRLALSRRDRPNHEHRAERVMDQLQLNNLGELMKASMEARG